VPSFASGYVGPNEKAIRQHGVQGVSVGVGVGNCACLMFWGAQTPTARSEH
jgi:hypothetical protein